MADVFPFKGYRYNQKKVDVNDVVTQPYDKISSEMQEKYYEKNPYNFVRLILSKSENRYSEAAENLEKWKEDEILINDESPSFYAYWQEYKIDGEKRIRKGFVGLGKLEDGEGVKAHENTMEGPKADRLKLLKATEANFGHIFMLYSDPKQKINNLLENKIKNEEPLYKASDNNNNIHKLWRIDDKESISLIKKYMQGKELYIADGHHRYQTALNYKKECEEKNWKGGFDQRLMTFININDPGLKILPTHRLLYGIKDFKSKEVLKALKGDFKIEEFTKKEDMYKKLDDAQDKKTTFGFKANDSKKYYTLTREKEVKDLVKNYSREWQNLDVTILHKLILEKLLGIDSKALEQKTNLKYVRNREKALSLLEKDQKFQAAFLLNPTNIEDVVNLADRGEKMPQKSTDFYPKLLSGLVFHKLNIYKN